VLERGTDGGSLAEVLSKPGFSTASEVTDVAGRGVGLDAVKQHVESFGGTLVVDSEPGAGMVVTLLLPYSVALMRVLLIERGEQVFGVPLASVEEVTVVGSLLTLVGSESLEVHGEAVPLRDLATLVGAQATELGPQPRAVIVMSSRRRQAVACDRVVGEREVMLKSLGKLLSGVPGYLGAAIIDDGGIAPILDPAFLARQIAGTALPAVQEGSEEPSAPKVLVVDDQFTVRELQRSILEAAGYRVVTARDGREAWSQLADDAEVQLVVTDVQMPEMDGIELLQKIRADPRRSAIPVVVLTSLAADGEKQRGADAGADAYIVKDEFDQRALLDTVERLLVLR
jgi:two-component system chemotaxis sensor kinase CheA